MIVLACIVTVACGPGETKKSSGEKKSPYDSKFDLNTIPCGELVSAQYPCLVILTKDNEMMRVSVPEWVYDVYKYKIGSTIGNCSGEQQ